MANVIGIMLALGVAERRDEQPYATMRRSDAQHNNEVGYR